MKRGFLLHNHRKPDRSAVSQRVASTSRPSPDSAMLAHAAIVQHASALALLTREPAVLWLCRHQESNEAVQHFQKEVKYSEDRLRGYVRELLAAEEPYAKFLREITGLAKLVEANDEATRRNVVKELRKQADEHKEYLLAPEDPHAKLSHEAQLSALDIIVHILRAWPINSRRPAIANLLQAIASTPNLYWNSSLDPMNGGDTSIVLELK